MVGKIVEIVADGRPGGGTTAVLGLCEDLLQAGEDVTLITDQGSYAAAKASEMGLHVMSLPFFSSRLDPRIPHALKKMIRELSPTVVHTHGARAGLPLSMLRQSRAEVRIYTVHGYHFVGKRHIARWLAWLAERRIVKKNDSVIFVSHSDREIALQTGIKPRDAEVIYNGISLNDFPVGFGEDLQKDTDFDLVFAARLHPQKNPLFVLDIARLLARDGIKILIIGGGELEFEMRAKAAAEEVLQCVTFRGALPRQEVLREIRRARLFLMPSLWEGLPIAPIEALASGLPVIGSDIPGLREVVRHQESGLLIGDFIAAEWAKAILDLLLDPELLAIFSETGRRDVSERFLRARSSAAHIAVYKRLTDFRA